MKFSMHKYMEVVIAGSFTILIAALTITIVVQCWEAVMK